MKFTFTGQYALNNQNNLVHITMYAKHGDLSGTIMIEDKDVRKTTISQWNMRHMTVHRDFAICNGGHITAEQERNQRMSSPNINYGSTFRTQNSKELLCGVFERDLIVDAGTFDKIVKIFNIFPDQIELLMFE